MARKRRQAMWVLVVVVVALACSVVLAPVPALAAPDGPGHCWTCWQNCSIIFYGWVCCQDHHAGGGAWLGVQGPTHCILGGGGCLVVVVTP